ncbi:STAS domain-containing protein [Micromonospora echinaurantiaca]|uniref:STAS domain-containing protein n=1 Tax=Micromonospora echinaurantiaca TaxID=47857 RepID=UPI0012FE0511|nr:STAS domain-containing protein [Micromonospora echinaurantiaca]
MTTRMALVVAVALVVTAGLLAGVLVQRRADGRRYRWLLAPLYRASRHPRRRRAAPCGAVRGKPRVPRRGTPNRPARRRGAVDRERGVAGAARPARRREVAFSRLPGQTRADRRVRRARTQIRPVRRLTSVAVTVAAIGLTLSTFPSLRSIGLSVLTSAGVVGALLGLSARIALGNAFAGIQVAFADAANPLGDVMQGAIARAPRVQVDLARVSFIDSTVLNAFVNAHGRASDRGVSLALVNPTGHVRRVLSMTGILPLLSTPDIGDY